MIATGDLPQGKLCGFLAQRTILLTLMPLISFNVSKKVEDVLSPSVNSLQSVGICFKPYCSMQMAILDNLERSTLHSKTRQEMFDLRVFVALRRDNRLSIWPHTDCHSIFPLGKIELFMGGIHPQGKPSLRSPSVPCGRCGLRHSAANHVAESKNLTVTG
jgi:hypothetical protein